MQYGWRVTKYDPQLRDLAGAFRGDTWTSMDDIGQLFGGERLTHELYLAMEDWYIAAALHFLNESGLRALRITGLELPARAESSLGTPELAALMHRVHVEEGQYLTGDALENVCRLNLRSLLWCSLRSPAVLLAFWPRLLHVPGCGQAPSGVSGPREWPGPVRRANAITVLLSGLTELQARRAWQLFRDAQSGYGRPDQRHQPAGADHGHIRRASSLSERRCRHTISCGRGDDYPADNSTTCGSLRQAARIMPDDHQWHGTTSSQLRRPGPNHAGAGSHDWHGRLWVSRQWADRFKQVQMRACCFRSPSRR